MNRPALAPVPDCPDKKQPPDAEDTTGIAGTVLNHRLNTARAPRPVYHWPSQGLQDEPINDRTCTMTNKMMLMATARAEALFASSLLTGSRPGRHEATTMINATVRRCRGVRGCAAEMAGAFGDCPEAAVRRMRWAREVALTLG